MATTIENTAAASEGSAGWTTDKARTLYNIDGWGAGFFDIDERGHVVVRPDKEHPERQLKRRFDELLAHAYRAQAVDAIRRVVLERELARPSE